MDEAIGDRWTIAKLTAGTRKKLEEYYGKKGTELEGKGVYLLELVERI